MRPSFFVSRCSRSWRRDHEIGGAAQLQDLVGHDGGLLLARGDRDGAGRGDRGRRLGADPPVADHHQEEGQDERADPM